MVTDMISTSKRTERSSSPEDNSHTWTCPQEMKRKQTGSEKRKTGSTEKQNQKQWTQTTSGEDRQEVQKPEAVLQWDLDSLVQGGGGHPSLSSHEATVQVCNWQCVARQDVTRLGGVA